MSSASSELVIHKLPFSQAKLFYKTNVSDDWTMLESIHGNAWHNVVETAVGVTGVKIKQKFPQGAGTCTLEVPREQISDGAVEIWPHPGNHTRVFWLSFQVLSKPVCVFSRTMKGNQVPHTLEDFPLHYYSGHFHFLQLGLPYFKLSQNYGLAEEDYKRHLLRFSTDSPPPIPKMEEAVTHLEGLMDGLVAESDAALASLKTMDECRVTTKVIKKKLWLGIYPKGLAEHTDDDLENKPTSMKFLIRKSTIFNDHPDVWGGHLIFASKTSGWQITMEPTKPTLSDTPAPLYATVDNSFGSSLAEFDGREEEGVTFQPVFMNIGGESAIAALADFKKQCYDEAREMANILTQDPGTAARSHLPARSLFLPGIKFDKANNRLGTDNAATAQEWTATLNDSQRNAVTMAAEAKFSIVHGPSATGKSETIARIACNAYHASAQAKIIVCCPTNTAVNECCNRIGEVWRASNEAKKGSILYMVRLYSQAQIEQQFRSGQVSVYTGPWHLDAIRLGIANKNPAQYRSYISGRRMLIEEHAIQDEQTMKDYLRAAEHLSNLVIEKARIVGVTCDSLQSRPLWRGSSDK
ncbi:MAG: hypothetical protein Q9183_001959, partial [Haloplaca sp. 2 TL-2023]